MESIRQEYNPYEPPRFRDEPPDVSIDVRSWQARLAQFQSECRALAGIPLFLAMPAGFYSLVFLADLVADKPPRTADSGILTLLFLLLTGLLIVLGLQIAGKKMNAVFIGTTIGYLMFAAVLITVPYSNIFGIVFAVVIGFCISQGHRVMRLSKELCAAGIPLNARINEVVGYLETQDRKLSEQTTPTAHLMNTVIPDPPASRTP